MSAFYSIQCPVEWSDDKEEITSNGFHDQRQLYRISDPAEKCQAYKTTFASTANFGECASCK
jgi:hypothetical protein